MVSDAHGLKVIAYLCQTLVDAGRRAAEEPWGLVCTHNPGSSDGLVLRDGMGAPLAKAETAEVEPQTALPLVCSP